MQVEDIKKLADLARIDMNEEEMIEIAKDFDSILAYIDQIKGISAKYALDKDDINKKSENYLLHNIMRDDVVTNNRGEYTDIIMNEMPDTQDGFLKVKQIM